MSINLLVATAYGVDSTRVIENGQEAHGSRLYDVEAKVAGDQQLTIEEMRPLLQELLKQRFGLVVHTEEKLVPGFALVASKTGSKLKPSAENSGENRFILRDRIYGRGVGTSFLASTLARSAGAPVMDKTGLSGTYDVDLRYRTADDANSDLPDIFTAVQEQLGLKLTRAEVPVKYLVIDHVDGVPTEN